MGFFKRLHQSIMIKAFEIAILVLLLVQQYLYKRAMKCL